MDQRDDYADKELPPSWWVPFLDVGIWVSLLATAFGMCGLTLGVALLVLTWRRD